MKIQFPFRFITLLLVLNIYINAPAQVSFLQPDTAVWRFRGFIHYDPCIFIDNQYMLSNQDTTVGNYTYRKMYQMGISLLNDSLPCITPPLGSISPSLSIPILVGLLREEGRKVYFWYLNYPSEFLAYDFDKQVGDSLLYYPNFQVEDTVTYNANYPIITIDEIFLNGKIFKQYIIGPNEFPIDTIIEGIGTTNFPFFGDAEEVYLVCYSRNDTVYYHRYDSCAFFEYPQVITSINGGSNPEKTDPQTIQLIYPNPAANDVNIVFTDREDYTVEIVDLMGRISEVEYVLKKTEINLDLSSLQNGTYILYIKDKGNLISSKKIVVLR